MNAPFLRDKHDGDLGGPQSVAVWLRMLSATMIVEKRLRRRFAERHGTTLPRFDVLAALDRSENGLSMGQLSAKLLVSNGNVTSVVQALARDALVAIQPSPTDRRSSIVALTDAGRAHFAGLAAAHHAWIDAMFAGLTPDDRQALFGLLGRVKHSIAREGDDD